MKAIRSRDKLQDDARFRLDDTFHHDLSGSIPDDLMKPHVTEVVVCNPRKTALLKEGSKGDKIDARKLAEPLRFNHLSTVYHGEHGLRTQKELGRSYLTITKDVGRVMNRLKVLYRSWAIPSAGTEVYAARHRSEWLGKIREADVRWRAEHYCSWNTSEVHETDVLGSQSRDLLFPEARIGC